MTRPTDHEWHLALEGGIKRRQQAPQRAQIHPPAKSHNVNMPIHNRSHIHNVLMLNIMLTVCHIYSIVTQLIRCKYMQCKQTTILQSTDKILRLVQVNFFQHLEPA